MPKPRLPLLAALTVWGALSCVTGLSSQLPISNFQVQAQTLPTLVSAASANSISLTAIPPRVGDEGEIKIKPGEKFQTTVRILNTSDVELDVESFVQDFIIDVDGKTPVPVRESVENRWSLASWVVLTPSHQVIAPKKTVSLSVLIDVPKDARPGGHYAMILHKPNLGGREPGEQSSSGVNQQVGSLLYVNVDGPIDELAFIRGFAFKPNFAEYGPVDFSYSVDNQSDVHIRPAGTLQITDIFHRKVGQVEIESQNVFPGAQRAFAGTWPVKWGFGPYTALLTVTYGEQGQLATASTVVWLFPISIIITILVVLLTIITAIFIIKRRPGVSQPPQASVDTTAPPATPSDPPLV